MSLLDLETLLRVPYVEPYSGFDISPDGSQLAFSWNKSGRWQIYLKDLNQDSLPRQITRGAGAKFAPRWKPDGSQLAYVLDLDGGENYDILVHDLIDGTHTNITANTHDALSASFSWSPDGSQIAFCSDRAGRFDTYIMPSQGGKARIILDQPRPDWQVVWSPDGQTLAVTSEGAGHDYWTFLVPVEGGQPTLISNDHSPIPAKDACWSPDGSFLAFASNLPGPFQIAIYEIASGSITWLTEGQGEKEYPDWSEDGYLTYVISHGPKSELATMQITSRLVSTYHFEPGVISTPKFRHGNQQIILGFNNPSHPVDLWSFQRATDSFHQVTFSLPVQLDQDQLVMPEEVWYPGLDGVEVPALLYRPQTNGELPPAVITIHGGPNWLTQITWDPLVQQLVSRGWVVLAPNYRGSTGYGRHWMNANRFDLGGVDTDDVVAGADFLIRQGIADPSRIALTGRSWGGYLTMTCMTRYPEKWAAGSAVVPFLNWFTSHANSRPDLQHWDIENFGDPLSNHNLWFQRSPFFFLDRIQAPVQLICGTHDVRCPASESRQAYDKLISLGKDCEYHLYPDEGHSFLKIENQVKEKTQRAAFLARYLENK
jgi:dipeptidyl aminopeptidase/acylaminoacyl peptidase